METDIFEKRPGTTDRGKDYEDLIVANLIVQLVEDEKVKDFKLSSNDKNFGAFDDVVLEVESVDGCNENYALQLKHSERNKILTEESLQGEKGDFSIQKYLKNVLALKSKPSKTINFVDFKWILLTNRKFDNKNGKKIKFEKEDFDVEILRCTPQSLLTKTFKNGKFYKFKVDPQVTRKEYCEFFDNFFLYTNQPNVDDVKAEISSKFQETFCCEKNIFGDYLAFITEWSVREGKKEKLNKKLMKDSIALRLLSPFIQPLSTTTSDVTESRTILQDAISKFHITILEQQNKEKITEMFGDIQKDFNKTDPSAINKTGKKFQVISSHVKKVEDLDKMEYTKLLWLMDKCPLIVLDNNSITKAVNLCADKNFIVLSDGGLKNFTNMSLFRNLTDLKTIDGNIYQRILENFLCSLQGKETVSLEALIESNNEIEAVITPDTLFSMLDSPFVIGENEKLPLPYIKRMLSKHLIHCESLEKLPEDTAVIITGANKGNKPIDNRWFVLDLECLTKDPSVGFFQPFEKAVMFYISKNEVSKQKFTFACSQIRKRNPKKKKFHQFRVFNSEMFEWTRSSGSINDLQKSIVTHFVRAEEMYNCENDINILCDNPGMGKTTLMKSVKNTTAPLFWTVLVYPKDHNNFFRKGQPNPDLFTEYLLNKYRIQLKTFESKLLEVLFKHNHIVYIWDGLDEVSEKNLKTVLDLIDNLSKKGIKQWVTSRNNLKEMLEARFNVVSRTVQQVSQSKQRSYMRNRLDFSLHKKIERMQFFKSCEILSNPLHIFIFTELLLQNATKYEELLNNKIFSITDLLGYFVDEKFNIYHRKEREAEANDITSEKNEWFKKEHIMFYEKAAMKTYFEESILQETNIHFEELLNEFKKKGKDPVGIITDISEENVVNFAHNSYGEYFAALYLSKNLSILSKFAKFFFRERYSSIRFMFDSILAEGFRAHLAVLYRDLDSLIKCDEDELKICDRGGRNAFQLACSYGRNYSEIKSKKRFFLKKYLIDDKKDQVEKENNEYNDIIRYLVEKCDIGIKDKIFNLDSVEYADKASCLLPQAVLLSKNKLKNLQNIDVPKILYYSVIVDLPEVFDSIQQIPYVYRYPDNSLLHLSAEKGSVNCFRKLIGSDTYGNIFKKLHEQTNLLFIAHIYNQPRVYQVLKELKVDDVYFRQYNIVRGHQPGRFRSIMLCSGAGSSIIEKFFIYSCNINFYVATGRRLDNYFIFNLDQ